MVLAVFCCTPAFSKAHLIVVFPLRSTPALAAQAKTASAAVVDKLSAIEGYDAQLVPEPKSGTLGAAAASAGAEIYVVGQLVESDNGYKITLGSFSAATEQPISNYTVTLAAANALPAQPDIKILIAASAPAAAPVGPAKLLVVPFELPGSTDPFEMTVSQNILTGLTGMNVAVTRIAPMDGIEAVANASKLCADDGGSGLLLSDGRYQATMKPGFFSVTVNTHVDFRLIDVACDGTVRGSTAATGDDTVTGMNPNVPGSVTNAFNTAVQRATSARATTTISQSTAAPAAQPSPAAVPAVWTYVVVPFDMLGMADERRADLTNSLVKHLQDRGLQVKSAAPIDRFTSVAHASQLCSDNGAQAIVVPSVRMEANSTTGSPHAVLHLTLLSCSGTVIGRGVAQGNFRGAMLFFQDPDGAVINATNDAMQNAIAQLLQGRQASAANPL